MHEIFGHLGAEIATDGSRRRGRRIGRAHHGANDGKGVVGSFDHSDNCWAPRHERFEVVVETLANVLFVVLIERGGVELAQFDGGERQALALESAENFTDEAAVDGVWLTDDKCSTHVEQVTAQGPYAAMAGPKGPAIAIIIELRSSLYLHQLGAGQSGPVLPEVNRHGVLTGLEGDFDGGPVDGVAVADEVVSVAG